MPQHHRTIHNDKWWGTGFTDWMTVKEAKPLFESYKQPVAPIDDNYYDLLNKDALVKQAEMAAEFGVDGFIFYHYYFGDGIMELEKPAENLLKWTDIRMPFCFSWANESWVRTWSNVLGNVWSEKFERDVAASNKNGVLVSQRYGDKKEWKKHFEYLMPFFKDSRYLKEDGKPIFVIHQPNKCSCIREMIEYWRELATQNGLKGIYFIGNDVYSSDMGLDAIMFNEGGKGIRELDRKDNVKIINGVRCYDYCNYLNNVLDTAPVSDIKSIFNVAVGHDSTPRRGKNEIWRFGKESKKSSKSIGSER